MYDDVTRNRNLVSVTITPHNLKRTLKSQRKNTSQTWLDCNPQTFMSWFKILYKWLTLSKKNVGYNKANIKH